MVIDTSAVVAILFGEPEATTFAEAIEQDAVRLMSHAAALNFGDCFSYALSRSTAEPLLFKGDDFPRTDVAQCLLR